MEPSQDWRHYTSICRLCMRREGFMLGIFNHYQGKDKNIYKQIMDFTSLEISFGDGLPNSICHRCLYKIEFCLDFKHQCCLSDAAFRQMNGASDHAKAVPSKTKLNTVVSSPAVPPTEEDENVVMVVDPFTLDYDSEYESEINGVEHHSEPENTEVEYKNVFMCKFCDQAFTDKVLCLNHELNTHDNLTPYNCKLCDMNFVDRMQFSAHLKCVHHNDKPFNCPECKRIFARRSDLRKHTIVHTGVKPFTCPICHKSFSRNTNLSKHIRLHKGQKPFVCQSCPKTFMSKVELTKHSATHSGVKPFKCNYCHLSFTRKDKFNRHQLRHFPQQNARDKTEELIMMRENLSTNYGFMNNNALKADNSTENMVINIDPFQHNDQEEQSNYISQSGSAIKSVDILPRVPEHITGDSFMNQPGPEMNETKDGVQSPSITTEHRPFQCTLCTKSFIRKRELDRHMATHTGMKPFKCNYCDKKFGRKDKLLRHIRIHDVNKEHVCFICGASFNRKDGLSHHMKSHEKEEEEASPKNE